jgi:hypothetical protein
MPAKKNVLLIVVDQWRGLMLPKLGADYLKLPNIDRLCAEGVTFRNHFTQTVPCGPARASLLTSLYMMNHRAVQNTIPLADRFTNLAHELRRGGYDPALVGYTTTTPDPRHTSANDPRFFVLGDIMDGFHSVGSFENRDAYFGWVESQGLKMPKPRENIWLPQARHLAARPPSLPSFPRSFPTPPGSPSAGSTICAAMPASRGSCTSATIARTRRSSRPRPTTPCTGRRTCPRWCALRRRRSRPSRTRCSRTTSARSSRRASFRTARRWARR